MDLFRKKSVDQLVSESTPLKRTLKTFDLTMLGIGAIIGTGIFVLTGKGALTAGPALCVSFLLAAVCCGFAGLCYAEFAAMAPVSGSAYSYAYLAFGELIAFVIGWDLILEYALQAATVSAGWSGYFNKLLEGFGLHLPVELTAAYGTTPGVTTYFNLPGFVIVLIITWVLSIGIKYSAASAISFQIASFTISLSGLAVGAIVGIVLNAVLPGKDYEFHKDNEGSTSVNFEV